MRYEARMAQSAAATATHGSGDVHSDTGQSQITRIARPTEGEIGDEERDLGETEPEPASKIARFA